MLYQLVRKWLFKKDAETAHLLVSEWLRRFGNWPVIPDIVRLMHFVEDERLSQEVFGLIFPNPIGLAAGMDKTGERLPGWRTFGFGFLEVGGFTFLPQKGNPEPRLFRLVEDEAIVNCMGFNNPGAEQMEMCSSSMSARRTHSA